MIHRAVVFTLALFVWIVPTLASEGPPPKLEPDTCMRGLWRNRGEFCIRCPELLLPARSVSGRAQSTSDPSGVR